MPSVNADRWRALSPYLDEVLDSPTVDRGRLLASVDALDPALAADLKALLAERDAAHQSGFLQGKASNAVRTTATNSLVGQVFNGYRLVSFIGQGGMGSVWLAERRDGRLERRAAVKLLNLSLVGSGAEQRFYRESRILARLTHPNIAYFIDTGVSPAGQPYLVLEHVDGQPISRYCDERALGIEARVRLFLDLLEAVSYAHGHDVVHRDLKPDNVLVSASGRVKLIDFGVANSLEDEREDRRSSAGPAGAPIRDAGAFTPQYAAPEQFTGAPVTKATDVYALGVLLYVLLTGRHPAGANAQPPAALIRAVVDDVPPRPSDTFVNQAHSAEARVRAARRGESPSVLRRMLRGDLDAIVAKALKKAARERYPSAAAMADDIRCHLECARTDRLPYWAPMFVRSCVSALPSYA